MAVPPAEPSAARLGGSAPARVLRRGFLATRPAFLTASALPVLLGTAWGARAGAPDVAAAALALAATVLLHAASNVFNDVGDELGGSDRHNDGRIHPFTGGSRFIQNGVMGVAAMARLSVGLFAAAVACGAMLALYRGWPVLLFGWAGLLLGILYSWPRWQLAARGLGELAVACAFGLLPVAGAAWLQQGRVDLPALALGAAAGAWIAAVLLINEVPDRAADAAAGKRTLAVRLGLAGTAWLYRLLQLAALAAVIAWISLAGAPPWAAALPGLLAAAGWRAGGAIAGGARSALAGAIRLTLSIHAAGCLWLTGWAALAVP